MGSASALHEQREARLDVTEEGRRQSHAKARAEHWDDVARDVRRRGRTGRYSHQRLTEIYCLPLALVRFVTMDFQSLELPRCLRMKALAASTDHPFSLISG